MRSGLRKSPIGMALGEIMALRLMGRGTVAAAPLQSGNCSISICIDFDTPPFLLLRRARRSPFQLRGISSASWKFFWYIFVFRSDNVSFRPLPRGSGLADEDGTS